MGFKCHSGLTVLAKGPTNQRKIKVHKHAAAIRCRSLNLLQIETRLVHITVQSVFIHFDVGMTTLFFGGGGYSVHEVLHFCLSRKSGVSDCIILGVAALYLSTTALRH